MVSAKNKEPPKDGGDAPVRKRDGELRFLAKGDLLVSVPGTRRLRYVGRATDGHGRWPATREPFAVEPNTDAARRLVKLTRRDSSLFPADEFTARACGLPFVTTKFVDGEHIVDRKKDS